MKSEHGARVVLLVSETSLAAPQRRPDPHGGAPSPLQRDHPEAWLTQRDRCDISESGHGCLGLTADRQLAIGRLVLAAYDWPPLLATHACPLTPCRLLQAAYSDRLLLAAYSWPPRSGD